MPANPKTGAVVIDMTFERETPGTFRFHENGVAEGQRGVITTLYVQKSAFPSGQPKAIRVTIEPTM